VSAFELVRAEAANFPVSVLCELLDVSTSGYYAWLERPPSTRDRDDVRLVAKIRAVHSSNGAVYGSRRMTEELRADDEVVGRSRVVRLMQEHELHARKARKFKTTTDSKHDKAIAPNLLEQQFDVDAPNEAWVGDITYVWTTEGWGYLAVLIDLFSRRVVGWSFADHMRRELPLKALERAFEAREPDAGLIHHSDRGSQYASGDYRAALTNRDVACSMSRAGDCYDNAVAESFFASLKKECIHRHHFATRTEAYDAIAKYIDGFYNPIRRHSALGYLSPIDYERSMTLALAA
jgi:transposase InsO family protein